MTTDTLGGVWTYSLDMCKALQPYNVEVYLVSLGKLPGLQQQNDANAIKNIHLYSRNYHLEWMENPWQDVMKTQHWLEELYDEIQPDLVQLNNFTFFKNPVCCPVILVYHSCVQTWWKAVKKHRAPATWDRYTKWVQKSLNSSNLVVAPTEAMLKSALKTHGFSTEAKVIYNGRDLEVSESTGKKEFILCAGRIWDEAKNLNILSRIAEDLPWPVYVAGNAVNPNTGEKANIKNVRFLGELTSKELQLWMQQASIFLSPVKYEPFGLAILEAAASGCALALNDIDTLRELWDEAAEFFNAEDVSEIKESLIKIIEDPAYLQQLSSEARERAKEFNLEKAGEKYYQLYRNLINQHKTNQLTPAL
ncbi:MAG: glycosyltransferase family 4 protein [Gillisia sp.]